MPPVVQQLVVGVSEEQLDARGMPEEEGGGRSHPHGPSGSVVWGRREEPDERGSHGLGDLVTHRWVPKAGGVLALVR